MRINKIKYDGRTRRGLLALLLILIGWQLLASSGLVSVYLLPKPGTVLTTGIEMWRSGVLAEHIRASLLRIALGFALSGLAGLLLAGLTIRFRALDDYLAAPLALLRMIPPLAVTPLLILWLGIGSGTQLAIVILASFFPIFLSARDGFSRVSEAHRELAASLNLPPLPYFTHIALPSALPSIVTGLRLAFSYSWRALIGAELIAAASGLGYLVMNAQEMLRTDEVFVGILCIGVLGWILEAGFMRGTSRLLRRRFPEIAA
ncbi:MAG: ABC transporter permease [Deltaproteobacteria bacterium]|jgi:ABC-type nitrate/sulfonate/bicarbonate transport system permease component|nr:ABC transporter permease [Deltaproteobacteria bacterium]